MQYSTNIGLGCKSAANGSSPKLEGDRRRTRSLDNIPLEILNNIFFFACMEDLDLSLLSVSQEMEWKLIGHPVIKMLRAFCPRHLQKEGLISFLGRGSVLNCHKTGIDCIREDEDEKAYFQNEILRSSWCNPDFIKWLQFALLKRVVKEHWDPLLQRDGFCKSAMAYSEFWESLNRSIMADTDSQYANDIELHVNDNEHYFSWTRLRVWPLQGRVVIRDQLQNTNVEIKVPLMQNGLNAKLKMSLPVWGV